MRGTYPRAARGRIVLQRLDPSRGWRNVARARVRAARASRRLARRSQRTHEPARRARARAGAAEDAPVAFVNVYRPAKATFFGPGLWGNPTYCGQS